MFDQIFLFVIYILLFAQLANLQNFTHVIAIKLSAKNPAYGKVPPFRKEAYPVLEANDYKIETARRNSATKVESWLADNETFTENKDKTSANGSAIVPQQSTNLHSVHSSTDEKPPRSNSDFWKTKVYNVRPISNTTVTDARAQTQDDTNWWVQQIQKNDDRVHQNMLRAESLRRRVDESRKAAIKIKGPKISDNSDTGENVNAGELAKNVTVSLSTAALPPVPSDERDILPAAASKLATATVFHSERIDQPKQTLKSLAYGSCSAGSNNGVTSMGRFGAGRISSRWTEIPNSNGFDCPDDYPMPGIRGTKSDCGMWNTEKIVDAVERSERPAGNTDYVTISQSGERIPPEQSTALQFPIFSVEDCMKTENHFDQIGDGSSRDVCHEPHVIQMLPVAELPVMSGTAEHWTSKNGISLFSKDVEKSKYYDAAGHSIIDFAEDYRTTEETVSGFASENESDGEEIRSLKSVKLSSTRSRNSSRDSLNSHALSSPAVKISQRRNDSHISLGSTGSSYHDSDWDSIQLTPKNVEQVVGSIDSQNSNSSCSPPKVDLAKLSLEPAEGLSGSGSVLSDSDNNSPMNRQKMEKLFTDVSVANKNLSDGLKAWWSLNEDERDKSCENDKAFKIDENKSPFSALLSSNPASYKNLMRIPVKESVTIPRREVKQPRIPLHQSPKQNRSGMRSYMKPSRSGMRSLNDAFHTQLENDDIGAMNLLAAGDSKDYARGLGVSEGSSKIPDGFSGYEPFNESYPGSKTANHYAFRDPITRCQVNRGQNDLYYGFN